MGQTCGILVLQAAIVVLASNFSLHAESFRITSAGELNLDSKLISNEGQVNKYFGAFINGAGEGGFRVSSNGSVFEESYTFRNSSTRLSSFFFPNQLATTDKVFRRGVQGDLLFEILEPDGSTADAVTVRLDVLLPKKNCQRQIPCKQAVLTKITKRQRNKLIKAFVQSIRGPITLEP